MTKPKHVPCMVVSDTSPVRRSFLPSDTFRDHCCCCNFCEYEPDPEKQTNINNPGLLHSYKVCKLHLLIEGEHDDVCRPKTS